MKRLLRILGIAAAVLLLLLLAAGLWLRSEAALRFAVAELESRTHGALKVGEADGTLMGPFTLKDLEFTASGVEAHVASVTLDWNPFALLAGAVEVHSLDVQGVDVRLTPTPQRSGPLFPLHAPVMPLLPVRIVLQKVRVRDAVLHGVDGSDLLQLDSADFSGRVSNRSIALQALRVSGPAARVAGEVELATRRNYQTHADLSWRWRPPSVAELSGRTLLDGDAKRFQLSQTLQAPYALSLKAELKDAFTSPTWSGELAVSRLSAAAIRPGSPAYAAGGTLLFQGGLAGTWIKGGVQADSPQLGPLDARVDLRLDPRRLQFRALSLKLAKSGAALDLNGEVRLAAGAPASLSGTWRNAGWPGHPWLDSPSGRMKLDTDAARVRLAVAGTLAPQGDFDARFELDRTQAHAWSLSAAARDIAPELPLPAAWMEPLSPSGDWRLAAHGDADTLHLDRLSGDWLDGSLDAQARYARSDGRWQAKLNLRGVDPEALSEDWPGKLDAVFSAEGGTGSGQALHLKLESLQGVLRDNRVDASADLRLLGRGLQRLTVDAALGDNSLHLGSDESRGEELQWRLDAADLSQVWPDAGGALHSQGTLDADKRATALQFMLDGKALAWHHDQVDTLHAEGRVAGPADAHGLLSAHDLTLAGRHITSLDAHADGTLENHALQLELVADDGGLKLAGSGGYAGGTWHGSLDRVDLSPTGAGDWHAPSPWSLDIAAQRVALAGACLLQADARACGDYAWQGGPWRSHAEIDRLPLSALQAVLPSGLSYTGALHAALDASGGTKAGTRIDLDADLLPGGVQNLVQGKQVSLLAYTSGKAYLHVTPATTRAGVNWQLTDGGALDVAAEVRRGPHPQLMGHVRGRFDDFQLLPAMIPQVSSASGRLTLDVTLSGTTDDPQFGGGVAFDGGDLTVPLLGVHMQDASLHLNGNASQLNLDGSARSGTGRLLLTAVGQRRGNVWHADGTLKGDAFRVVDIPEARVEVSPDLAFTLDDRDVTVSGSVTIPSAHLRPRDLTSTAQVSADQVIVGEEGGLPREKWHVHAAIRAILGEQVDFEGFGLSGDIGGQVLAVDEPGHITTGSGELTISNGLYSAFGQQLQIDNGKLLFNGGPIADPAMDIRALRKPAHPEMLQPGSVEQKVGVIVRGTLRKPTVTLFSDPPLPQAQATNYLLFGSTGLETSATTAGSLPASAAGGQGTDIPNFSAQIGGGNGSFDISKQNVQSASGTQTASLFFGKYLSPRLYISYGVGLYDPITVKRLIYKLSEKWTLQAESGAANSADIIYTLEH